MIYAKGVLLGIALSLLAWFVTAVVYTYFMVRPKGRVAGLEPQHRNRHTHLRAAVCELVALSAFALGFYWELHG
jgi:hypothetical protein